MEKKDIAKALLCGVFSVGSIGVSARTSHQIDIDKPVIKVSPSKVKKVVVDLKPISQEVGSCFDEVGQLMRESMGKVCG
ncbi:MAG: hypothetical protein MJY98_03510 [Fibrobacter sp.]|nr:hypothetical protein [Fibrobacter sp.]